jgi:hypothetical protein
MPAVPNRRAVWKNELRLVVCMLASGTQTFYFPEIKDQRRLNRLCRILKNWFAEYSKIQPNPDSYLDLRDHVLWKKLRNWARMFLASGIAREFPKSMAFLQYEDYLELDRECYERYPKWHLPYVMEYE